MNLSDFAEKFRVKVGVLTSIIIIFLSTPSKLSLLGGFFLSLLGNLLRLWASGYIRKEKELARSGPYSLTRNPLYLGNFIIGAGFCIASWQFISLPVFFLYFLFFYIPLIKNEEKRMKEIFKEDYIEYKKRVPVFLPKFNRIERTKKFSFRNILENKEWRAILSTLLFYLALLIKMVLIK